MLKVEIFEGENEKASKDLEVIAAYFLRQSLPMCFNPYDERSVLINGEKEFEEMCNAMEDNGVNKVKESTVFEFYSKIKYLEDKVHKLKQHAGKSL